MQNHENSHGHDIIVVGASAGGVEAISALAAQLPANLPAALFVVVHTSSNSPGHLADVIGRRSRLPAKKAADGDRIQHGHIYVAPPDHHLLVNPEHVRLVRGPRENMARPAIDPLFRSAAVAYGARVVGVILSGMLDDGASGLLAVQRCGGTTVVQSPEDATFPDMPRNALAAVTSDHTLPLAEMGALLNQLVRQPVNGSPPVPGELLLETKILEKFASTMHTEAMLGELVPYSCPECSGPLWAVENETVRRYRCNVGHAFTAQTLLAEQGREIEEALWYALRVLEQRNSLLTTLANDSKTGGRNHSAVSFQGRAAEVAAHAELIRKLLQSLN